MGISCDGRRFGDATTVTTVGGGEADGGAEPEGGGRTTWLTTSLTVRASSSKVRGSRAGGWPTSVVRAEFVSAGALPSRKPSSARRAANSSIPAGVRSRP